MAYITHAVTPETDTESIRQLRVIFWAVPLFVWLTTIFAPTETMLKCLGTLALLGFSCLPPATRAFQLTKRIRPSHHSFLATKPQLPLDRRTLSPGLWSAVDERDTQAPLPASKSETNGVTPVELESSALIESEDIAVEESQVRLKPWQSHLTRIAMITYIAAMCVALPLTLYPQKLCYKLGFLIKSRAEKEHYALATGQFCARWLLRCIPFCRITNYPSHHPNPPESVWVSNHQSMLDVFVLLAADRQLRGKTKRPIKIVYWKQLEKNPITRLLFKQAGFIPVQMAANKAGEDNDYDRSSFKQLLKDSKQAFADGFDIGVLPEGQLNPSPEKGLLPVFSGAFTLARMSKRPVQMLSLKGVHDLWHPVHGLHCVNRHVQIRAYPYMFRFGNSGDFVDTFKQMVGHFALHGKDLSEEEQNALLYKNLVGNNGNGNNGRQTK